MEVTPSGQPQRPSGVGRSRSASGFPDFLAMFSSGKQVRQGSSSLLIESTIFRLPLPRKGKTVLPNGDDVLLSKERKTLSHCNLAVRSATIHTR
jgi:hypothetical protein